MKKYHLLLLFLTTLCSATLFSQITIKGVVFNEYIEPFIGATVKIKSKKAITNFDGNFTLKTKEKLPITIKITYVGYEDETIIVTSQNQEIEIILKEKRGFEEVVISASRTPERILESPVTIERMGINDIKKNSSFNFYDGLENLKGVDMHTNSLAFKSINTRGFSTIENVRFVQLVDGMDTAAPALNFSVGNVFGAPELDIESVEILPGASSALYGANAFNGVLIMNTKSPFDYKGISLNYKTGVRSKRNTENSSFQDISIRMAHEFNKYFAAKGTLISANGEEWNAEDYRNSSGVGGVITSGNEGSPNYDGVNVYGDEVSYNMLSLAKYSGKFTKEELALIPNVRINRTGYKEVDLVDNKSKKINFATALHIRPWGNDKLEIIWNSKFNKGNNMYHGQNRYFQKNFSVTQHKLEFKAKDYFLRGYYSKDNAGDSYNTRFAGVNINKQWKSYKQWYIDYILEYKDKQSHEEARKKADQGRYKPGTKEFQEAFNSVINSASTETGAKFKDKSSFFNLNGNYNLKRVINFAEIQIGGSYRNYVLRSDGSIFTDLNSNIHFDEFGIYTQLQKKLLDEKLRFTTSVRYDKSTNFKGHYSPRVSLAYSFGKEKRRNLRASFQTAFRNPTSQEQYIGLFTGSTHILGTAPDNLDRYSVIVNNNNNTDSKITGRAALENAFTAESFRVFSKTGKIQDLVKSNYNLVHPERISSYEIGYRALLNISKQIFELDFNTYYSNLRNLITTKNVVLPNFGKITYGTPNSDALLAIKDRNITIFNIKTNSEAEVNSYGFSVGVKFSIFSGLNLGASYNWDDFTVDKSADITFKSKFNLPKHKIKLQIGHNNLLKNLGFNVNVRSQNSYLWQSSFLDGMIDSRTVLDAQFNYRMPSIKSRFKIGGTNLGGIEYRSAPGAESIGSVYYLSWTIND